MHDLAIKTDEFIKKKRAGEISRARAVNMHQQVGLRRKEH
jgi:hypothetical protein